MLYNYRSKIELPSVMVFLLLTGSPINICEAKTSLSHGFSSYTQFCQSASTHEHIFAQFRRAPAYTGIVETVSFDHGREYIATLKKLDPQFLVHIEKFKTSDKVGNPKTFFITKLALSHQPLCGT